MATLQQIYDLKASASLRNRLAVALSQAAEAVRSEALATAHHSERFDWAVAMLADALGPEKEAERGMWLLLQNATLQDVGESATDNDIKFIANSMVNFLAGVDTAE